MMDTFELIMRRKARLSSANKLRYVILGILLGLCLFYMTKSCSIISQNEEEDILGQDTRWPELHLAGRERYLSAFNQELLATIFRQAGLRLRWMIAGDLLKELQQGKVQGILTTLQPSYLYEQNFIFSEPYFFMGSVLILPFHYLDQKGNGKNKKIIGIPENSPLLSSLESDEGIQVKIYEDILPALTDLKAGDIDGAIFPALPTYTYIQNFYRDELKVATPPLTNEGIRLVTLKNERGKHLVQIFNESLEKLKANGTYHDLLERWGFVDVEQVAY